MQLIFNRRSSYKTLVFKHKLRLTVNLAESPLTTLNYTTSIKFLFFLFVFPPWKRDEEEGVVQWNRFEVANNPCL